MDGCDCGEEDICLGGDIEAVSTVKFRILHSSFNDTALRHCCTVLSQ